jgi:hypothetical protein
MRTSSSALVIPFLMQVLQQLAAAKITNSAREAKQLRYLSASDRVIMNRDHLSMRDCASSIILQILTKSTPFPKNSMLPGVMAWLL